MTVNNAPLYLRLNIAFSCLATLGVVLRVVARNLIKSRYGIDDVLIVVAWGFLVGLNINGGILYMNGGADGTSFDDLSSAQLETFFKCFYISQILYFLCMLPTKLSILAFYRRIFTYKSFRICVWVVVGICFCWFIGNLVPTVDQCRPTEKAWDKGLSGSCINMTMLFSAITISNLITDLIILTLPMFAISWLMIPLKTRLALYGIFLLGGSACVCTLVRVISQYRFGTDIGSLIVDCALWTVIEPALAVLAACLPTLKPLLSTSKLASFYSSFTNNGVASSSNTSSRKRHSSWFGGLGSSKSGSAVKSSRGYSGIDDAYPLKAFDGYGKNGSARTHTVTVPSSAKRGVFAHGKDTSTDAIEAHGNGYSSSGIYVTKEVTVNETSIVDR